MLAVERLQYILDALHKNKVVLVNELSKEIHVSEETIRRDLDKLEKENVICRVHGGAYLKEDNIKATPETLEQPVDLTTEFLAKYCIKFIHEYESIFLDSSLISYQIANELIKTEKKLTVITNCLNITNDLLFSENIRVILLGGELNKTKKAFFGQNTIDELNHYFVDKAFITSAGVSKEAGITDFTIEEALVHKSLLEQSKYRIYVTDGKNVDRSAIHVASSLDSIDCFISTDKIKESNLYTTLKINQIDISICNEFQ